MNTLLNTHDIAGRGQTLFETRIKENVRNENPDDFLAIDIESGDYEIGPDDLPTSARLRARRPEAVLFTRRVGDECAYSLVGGFADGFVK